MSEIRWSERRTLTQLREQTHGDPGGLIEECGAVVEALDAILDGLQKRLGKKDSQWDRLDFERIERQIERFYSNADLPHGGKLLNWYFSVEGERAIRLALSILEGIRTHQEYRYPETFRNISKLVFGWLRKSDPPCTWYWDVPEFRPFLMAHMPTREGQNIKPPRYWDDDTEDGGWPTLQRVVREILAQRDRSMGWELGDVKHFLGERSFDFDGICEQPRKIRELLQREEPRWFIASAEKVLRQMHEERPKPEYLHIELSRALRRSDLGDPWLKVEFTTLDPEHMLPGSTFELHLRFSFLGDRKAEFWDALERTVALLFTLEGVERLGAAPAWNSFQETAHGICAEVPLRLKCPAGRIRIEFASIGEQRKSGVEFYVGAVPEYLNAVLYAASKTIGVRTA